MSSTSISVTIRRTDGEIVTQNFSNVNPAAANADVANFMRSLGTLSNNQVLKIDKISKKDLQIPEVF